MQYETSGLLRIAVADDHALFREALCNLIDTWENCKVMLRAENGKSLIEKINPAYPPDFVLTDLQMPVMNGFETCRTISNKYPEVKIMVISQFHSEEMLFHLIRCGAHGFVNKNDDPDHLRKAIFTIKRDGYFFTDHAAARLVKKSFHADPVNFKNGLSKEEFDFLHHICTDKSYKEIAREMEITERHIEYLRNSLFERFDVKSRTGLAITSLKKGLSHWQKDTRTS